MCMMSAVIDTHTWPGQHTLPSIWPTIWPDPEIAKLRKELEEIKVLLKAAKKYDDATGQPDCETKKDKAKIIIDLAKALDVDLEGVLDKFV